MRKPLLKIDNAAKCTIVKRLNKFVAEVIVKGKKAKAYVNNTGRLIEYLGEGKPAFCITIQNPKKTSYRLFAVKDGNLGAIIDTQLQMRAFERAVEFGFIPWLRGCRIIRRNARLGESLVDYLLGCNSKSLYLEIKSAVLREGHYAMYPDCPSLRGRRHVSELTTHVRKGGNGAIVFIAAMPKVRAFRPYRSGDPRMHELLLKAHEAGVAIKSVSMYYDPKDSQVYLNDPDLTVAL